jgi:hypothetical protein
MAFATVQSYGGELFLRIVLYGLPILTILGVDSLRALVRRRRGFEKLLAVVMLLLFPLLVLIRGGNDAYMIVTPEDVAMTRAAFADTPPGRKVVPLDQTGPYAMQGVGVYERAGHVRGCSAPDADVVRCIEEDDPDVVLVYESMEKRGVYLENRPPGWTQQAIEQLVSSGGYAVRYRHESNAVLVKITPTVAGTGAPAGVPGGN